MHLKILNNPCEEEQYVHRIWRPSYCDWGKKPGADEGLLARHLSFDNLFVDFPEAEYPALHEVVRMQNPRYAAILFRQSAGGIIIELVQMVDPVPCPIRKDFRYDHIGLGKMTIAGSEVEGLFKELKGNIDFCSKPKSLVIPGCGEYEFVC